MFKDLFNSIATNLIPATVLFLLFLLALGAFVKRSDIPALAAGLGRLLMLVFVSPLNFLRKMIAEVVDAERREEYESVLSDQFLIRRNLASLKAGLVVGAILVLATGLGGAWATLPSRADFRTLREAKNQLAQKEQQLAPLTSQLAELEKQWLELKPSVVTKRQTQAEDELVGLRAKRRALEAKIPEELRATFGPESTPMPYGQYGRRESGALQTYYQSQNLQQDRSANEYFSILIREAQLAESLEELDERRSRVQPEWLDQHQALVKVGSELTNARVVVAAKRADIRERRSAAISAFVATLIFFYSFAWLIGLLIEGLSLVIRVAGDIRVLREQQPSHTPRVQLDDTVVNPVSLFRS